MLRPESNRLDVNECTALELSGKLRNRGSGFTVFDLNPDAELSGFTPMFLAVNWYLGLHSGSAAALLNDGFAGANGAKQRTARKVTPVEGFTVEADAATVGTSHVERAMQGNGN